MRCLIRQRTDLDDGKMSIEALAVLLYENCYLERREMAVAWSGGARTTPRLAPSEDDMEMKTARPHAPRPGRSADAATEHG